MINRIWIPLIIIVIIAVGISLSSFPDNEDQQAENKNKNNKKTEQQFPQAPDFELTDLEGNTVRLSDYHGKVVIIDFWATWCGPCRKGIPDFVELQNEYGEENFVVLGISVDEGEPPIVAEFASQYNINYPVLHDTPQVRMAYGGIRAIPTTFVVDKEGFVRQYVQGYRPKSFFQQVVDPLL